MIDFLQPDPNQRFDNVYLLNYYPPTTIGRRPRTQKIGRVEARHASNPGNYLEVKWSKVKVTR